MLHPDDLDALLTLPGLRVLLPEITAAVTGSGPVLVLGETGTGKTLLAGALAARMGLRPVVRAALGETDDVGALLAQADGGALILDEVLDLSLPAQQVLSDFVQLGTYRPPGYEGVEPRRARVRLLAVTHGDLEAAVREGRFRQDLCSRLAGFVLHVPPLRVRRGDIPGMASMLLQRIAPGAGWRLSLDARRALVSERLPWPGNVRQLEAALRRAIARAASRSREGVREITAPDLDVELAWIAGGTREDSTTRAPTSMAERWARLQQMRRALDDEERALLEEAIARCGGVLSRAARALGVPRTTLASRRASTR